MTDYGTDFSTYRGSTPDLSFVRISGARVVAEAVARRWVTARGTLVTDADAGVDLRAWLGASLVQSDLNHLALVLKSEAERDERVDECQVTVRFDPSTQTLTVVGKLDLVEGETFRLVLNVSDVTVELLEPA